MAAAVGLGKRPRASRHALPLLVSLVIAAMALTGCAASGSEGSRHALYDSVEEIAGDSSVVVVVEVLSQDVIQDDVEGTVSLARVIDQFEPRGLGATLPADAPVGASAIATKDEITVRQLGTISMTETPAPILAVGKQYLLFLTPTMLEGDGPTDFYVTGGDAGIYDVADDRTFHHDVFEAGDRLPTVLDEAALSDAD